MIWDFLSPSVHPDPAGWTEACRRARLGLGEPAPRPITVARLVCIVLAILVPWTALVLAFLLIAGWAA